jgi:molybdate transport system substrate-binding protein
VRHALFITVAVLVLGGCAASTTEADPGDETTLTVLAAASLTETFTELESVFEAEHPGVDVRLAFDSSATLATQVVQGAPADVLATADAPTMQSVVDSGLTATEPAVFATNTMVLVVPADNPADITRLNDLDRPGTSFVACAGSAPCGAIAVRLLDSNNVEAAPKSLEVDVKSVLTKVVLDEADAGLVYATDATAAGEEVRSIGIPHASEAVNHYLVAAVGDEPSGPAQAWIDLVLSPTGQDILHDAGFGKP